MRDLFQRRGLRERFGRCVSSQPSSRSGGRARRPTARPSPTRRACRRRLPAAGRGRGGAAAGVTLDLHRKPALRRRREGRQAAAGRRAAARAAADRAALRGMRQLWRHDRGHVARADLRHLRHPELAAGGAGAHLRRPADHRAERRALLEMGRRLHQSITFELRKGHKWSDGQPFTADDVVFFFEDIIENKELSPETTDRMGRQRRTPRRSTPRMSSSRFDEPFPGLLTYMATSGSYFSDVRAEALLREIHAEVQPEGQRGGQGGRVRGLDQVVRQLLPEVA